MQHKQCSREGCTKIVKKGGICPAHDAVVARKKHNAAVGDATVASFAEDSVADTLQSLMPPPRREKWISIYDPRASTMPLQRPHVPSLGGAEISTEPPALYDPPHISSGNLRRRGWSQFLDMEDKSHDKTRMW
jgi:hypothetical protein